MPRSRTTAARSTRGRGRPDVPQGIASGTHHRPLDDVLAIQRTVGNQVFGELLGAEPVGPAGQEARRPDAESDASPSLPSGGQSLDLATRRSMEARFRSDFSGVRVHTGPAASSAAVGLAAQAYSVGSDIVFGPGRYQPGSEAGRDLLAHELTHVIQQTRGGVAVGDSSAAETEADAVARGGNAGPEVSIQQAAPVGVQRAPEWWSAVKSRAGEYADKGAAAADAALDKASEKLADAAQSVADAGREAKAVVHDAYAAAKATAGEATAVVVEKARETKAAAVEKAREVQTKVVQVKAKATAAMQDARAKASEVGATVTGVAREVKEKAATAGGIAWQKARRKIGDKVMNSVGQAKGVLLEAATLVDSMMWLDYQARRWTQAKVESGLDWAQKKQWVSETTRTIVSTVNREQLGTGFYEKARGYGLQFDTDEQGKALDWGGPSITTTISPALDRYAGLLGSTLGATPESEVLFFTEYESGEIEGAVGTQVALAYVGAEEVQLVLKGLGAIGGAKGLILAIERKDDWLTIGISALNLVLSIIGLSKAKAAQKIVAVASKIGAVANLYPPLKQLYLAYKSEKQTTDPEGYRKGLVAAAGGVIKAGKDVIMSIIHARGGPKPGGAPAEEGTTSAAKAPPPTPAESARTGPAPAPVALETAPPVKPTPTLVQPPPDVATPTPTAPVRPVPSPTPSVTPAPTIKPPGTSRPPAPLSTAPQPAFATKGPQVQTITKQAAPGTIETPPATASPSGTGTASGAIHAGPGEAPPAAAPKPTRPARIEGEPVISQAGRRTTARAPAKQPAAGAAEPAEAGEHAARTVAPTVGAKESDIRPAPAKPHADVDAVPTQKGPLTPEAVDELIGRIEGGGETGGFEPVGPGVRVPVKKPPAAAPWEAHEPARILEAGAGKGTGPTGPTSLGIPPQRKLAPVTKTDIRARKPAEAPRASRSRYHLDATQPVPPGLKGRFETVLVNNPRGFTPNIAELGEALAPGGRIIVQGRGRIGPASPKNTRGFNPDFQALLDRPAPPGYRKILDVAEGGLPPAKGNTSKNIIGGPFYSTEGDRQIHPNARVIFEKLPSEPSAPTTPTVPKGTQPGERLLARPAAAGSPQPAPPRPSAAPTVVPPASAATPRPAPVPGRPSAGKARLRILIVGAEKPSEFAYARQAMAQGHDVVVANPKRTPAATAFEKAGGRFFQGRVADMPPGKFDLIREDFPHPTPDIRARDFAAERTSRLASGGSYVMATENPDFADAVSGFVKVDAGMKVDNRKVPRHHEETPRLGGDYGGHPAERIVHVTAPDTAPSSKGGRSGQPPSPPVQPAGRSVAAPGRAAPGRATAGRAAPGRAASSAPEPAQAAGPRGGVAVPRTPTPTISVETKRPAGGLRPLPPVDRTLSSVEPDVGKGPALGPAVPPDAAAPSLVHEKGTLRDRSIEVAKTATPHVSIPGGSRIGRVGAAAGASLEAALGTVFNIWAQRQFEGLREQAFQRHVDEAIAKADPKFRHVIAADRDRIDAALRAGRYVYLHLTMQIGYIETGGAMGDMSVSGNVKDVQVLIEGENPRPYVPDTSFVGDAFRGMVGSYDGYESVDVRLEGTDMEARRRAEEAERQRRLEVAKRAAEEAKPLTHYQYAPREDPLRRKPKR